MGLEKELLQHGANTTLSVQEGKKISTLLYQSLSDACVTFFLQVHGVTDPPPDLHYLFFLCGFLFEALWDPMAGLA